LRERYGEERSNVGRANQAESYGRRRDERSGLVQVYTGNGKGKTTAALGLALRACGHGLRVYIGQFLKRTSYGELNSVERLTPLVTIEQYGLPERIHADEPSPEQHAAARQGLAKAKEALAGGRYAIVILDELAITLAYGLVQESEVLAAMDEKPPHVELVITGRHAPASILARADLVSEVREVRHPYSSGIGARPGIEF
jgi:cob(I)alamin adenosyltransferase